MQGSVNRGFAQTRHFLAGMEGDAADIPVRHHLQPWLIDDEIIAGEPRLLVQDQLAGVAALSDAGFATAETATSASQPATNTDLSIDTPETPRPPTDRATEDRLVKRGRLE